MRTENSRHSKWKVTAAAVVTGAVLGILTCMFLSAVREQLWKQSVNTILESTQQGCNTLQVQLEEDYRTLGNIAGFLQQAEQPDMLDSQLTNYGQMDEGVSLYREDGVCLPSGTQADETVALALMDNDKAYGVLDPHISSVTGVNVFNLFIRVVMADGSTAYLVKEYEVGAIVDTFTLSFYQNSGFSYVVDVDGNVLVRPPHPDSNKTVQNLFDMLRESDNEEDSLQLFMESLAGAKTGWAVLSYQGEQTVFCYIPLKLGTDWHLISIIPYGVVSAQTDQIIRQTLTLIAAIIMGIALLVALYFYYTRQTAKRLRSQADYIGHLYNAVPEGIALLTMERPYRFIQLNREGLRLLEYPDDAANDAPRGRKLEDVLDPEDSGQIMDIIQETVMTGRKNPFENRLARKDGSLFWASGIIEKTLDQEGRDILIATFHDITAEKLAEEAAEREKLQERTMLVGAISNVFPVIISLNLSRDTLKFIYIGKGLMTDLGHETSFSQLYKEIMTTVHPDSLEEFKRRFAPDALAGTLGKDKREIFLEARQMLKDGQYHWISNQIIYVDNPYSEEKLAILLSRSIDEQRHEEEQHRQALQSALEGARAANTAKSQFLSNMSHDIRTPMNAIMGMAAIAATHLDDRERVTECLKKIGLSSRHLLSLINDILDMSKIESGKLSLREEPFNFAELVSEVVELMQPQAAAAQIELVVRLSLLQQETVIGDALRVRQVYLNILSNAVKYTRAGGSIQIDVWDECSSRSGRRNYLFRCADTGIGMDSEFLEHLFQPFERAQDSTTSRIAGTGLGMAITKNIVNLMSGDIQVESVQGSGSVFTVTMPMQLQDACQEAVPQEWIGIHSLVVDDDRQTCENAAELLVDMGLRAEFATEGRSAVERVIQAKNTPDPFSLVIIDWKMPDMDGVETARRIRQEVGPEIPVIILTAYDWSEIEREAREAGVTSFISKPFYRSKICYLLNEISGETQMAEAPSVSAARDHTGCRILLVEDNDINREIARILIEETGAEVEEAFDGAEAVQKISQAKEGYYDLIFMDIQMPNMNGYEATRAIRALGREDMAEIPIIAMTANAFDEDIRLALRSGMDAHFAKPLEVRKLEQILNRYLPQK
ncbi:response regulator [Clostridium sp. AN503]|uniref:response regulator n=1 Tax=Clostridium sp. AN503 TaxID=3160598 RepID=UPI00345A1807